MASLILTAANGQPGELLELQTASQSTQLSLVQSALLALSSFGLQSSWAINPVNGSDSNDGTPAAPLASMGEFNNRLSGNVVRQATTLQLVGDVTDEPLMLSGTRFVGSGALTVLGTVTATGETASVTVVTTLQSNCTWQFTTTGIVWTSGHVGKRLLLDSGGTCWVQEFVDANNVVVGPVSTTSATLTPTAPATLSVQDLSAALPPIMLCIAQSSAPLQVQNLTFSSATLTNSGAAALAFFGCRFTGGSVLCRASISMRGSLHQLVGLTQLGLGNVGLSLIAHTFVGAPVQIAGGTTFSVSSFQLSGITTALSAQLINAGAMHFRNCGASAAITLSQGAKMQNQNFAISGSVGNTGLGIIVRAGCGFTFLVLGTRPTVTGSGGDTRIGATTKTYAAIGSAYTDLLLNAIPPTVQQLTGTPAFMSLEN